MDPAEAVWKEHLQRLGGYIRAQRQFAHLSQRQLADMADLSDTYMSQLERGLHEPSIRVLRALAENLGLSTDQLLRRAAGLDGRATGRGDLHRGGDPPGRSVHRRPEAALLGVVRSYLDANDA